MQMNIFAIHHAPTTSAQAGVLCHSAFVQDESIPQGLGCCWRSEKRDFPTLFPFPFPFPFLILIVSIGGVKGQHRISALHLLRVAAALQRE
jgi:hypothetical protein